MICFENVGLDFYPFHNAGRIYHSAQPCHCLRLVFDRQVCRGHRWVMSGCVCFCINGHWKSNVAIEHLLQKNSSWGNHRGCSYNIAAFDYQRVFSVI